MNSKCLEIMDIEEFCKNHPPLNDSQKEKYDELYNRGWFDVAQIYWDWWTNCNSVRTVFKSGLGVTGSSGSAANAFDLVVLDLAIFKKFR